MATRVEIRAVKKMIAQLHKTVNSDERLKLVINSDMLERYFEWCHRNVLKCAEQLVFDAYFGTGHLAASRSYFSNQAPLCIAFLEEKFGKASPVHKMNEDPSVIEECWDIVLTVRQKSEHDVCTYSAFHEKVEVRYTLHKPLNDFSWIHPVFCTRKSGYPLKGRVSLEYVPENIYSTLEEVFRDVMSLHDFKLFSGFASDEEKAKYVVRFQPYHYRRPKGRRKKLWYPVRNPSKVW